MFPSIYPGSDINADVSKAFAPREPERYREALLLARSPEEHKRIQARLIRAEWLAQPGFKRFNTGVDAVFGTGFENQVIRHATLTGAPKSATETLTRGLHLALTAAGAPLFIPAYRAYKLPSGRAFLRRSTRNSAWRNMSKITAVLPGALSEVAALLGAGLKAAPLGVVVAGVKAGAGKAGSEPFVPVKNHDTLVMQEPLDELPKAQIFITRDRWQFDIDELFACLTARGDFLNPLSLEPLCALDLQRLAKHPRCPAPIARFLSADITMSTEAVRRLLALSRHLASDMEALDNNPTSVLALGQFSNFYNQLSQPERDIARQFGIESLLERTRTGNNCIHNTGEVVPKMVRQLLQAGRAEPDAMRYLDESLDPGSPFDPEVPSETAQAEAPDPRLEEASTRAAPETEASAAVAAAPATEQAAAVHAGRENRASEQEATARATQQPRASEQPEPEPDVTAAASPGSATQSEAELCRIVADLAEETRELKAGGLLQELEDSREVEARAREASPETRREKLYAAAQARRETTEAGQDAARAEPPISA